jgi:hypothetical protein
VINILLAEVKVKRNVRFYATGMLQRESARDRGGARLPHVVTPAPHRRVAAHSVRALRGVPSAFWARKLEFAAVITENDPTSEPLGAVVAGLIIKGCVTAIEV